MAEERETHRLPHRACYKQQLNAERKKDVCWESALMTVMEGHEDIAERICLVHDARITIDIK